jgi:uncharacterized membrane protein YkvA (DUF1232 family)
MNAHLETVDEASLKPRATRRRMKDLLLFVPNLIRLLGGLLLDGRVPKIEKLLIAGAILYAISPIDLIPDSFRSSDKLTTHI